MVCLIRGDGDAAAKGLELLVQNLSRLDESNEEDAKGVNTTMGVLENLLEVRAFVLAVAMNSLDSPMYPMAVDRRQQHCWEDGRGARPRLSCCFC